MVGTNKYSSIYTISIILDNLLSLCRYFRTIMSKVNLYKEIMEKNYLNMYSLNGNTYINLRPTYLLFKTELAIT